ncbi:ABC transporter ATP-binding protein [Luteococcus sediminum]
MTTTPEMTAPETTAPETTAPETTATIEGLTLRIPARRDAHGSWVHAATQVDLTLRRGRVHALVGESGCGKSVLASVLSGLVPPGTRVQGRVEVAGVDLTPALGRPHHTLWRQVRGQLVSAVPQSPATAFTPTRTVGSQLAEVLRALRDGRDAESLAERAGLPPWALAAYPHELSGGLAARAALATALAGSPQVLVADEPTAALDPELRASVLSTLRELALDGMAILLITHDLSSLIDIQAADDLSVMYAGHIVEHGPAARLLSTPQDDYTRALLAALPRNGLHPVPGHPPALTDLDDRADFASRLHGGRP